MSRATLYVQFPDGSVRYGLYDGTTDVAWPELFATPKAAWDNYGAETPFDADPPVPVRLATDYGGGCSWSGTSTRSRVIGGRDQFDASEDDDSYSDGLPSWAKYPPEETQT